MREWAVSHWCCVSSVSVITGHLKLVLADILSVCLSAEAGRLSGALRILKYMKISRSFDWQSEIFLWDRKNPAVLVWAGQWQQGYRRAAGLYRWLAWFSPSSHWQMLFLSVNVTQTALASLWADYISEGCNFHIGEEEEEEEGCKNPRRILHPCLVLTTTASPQNIL